MKKLLIASVAVAAAVYLLFTAFIQDFEINHYSDLQAVKEQQAIEKGWVPALLPPSAYEIAETHDLDSNEVYGTFRYKEPDEAALLSTLTDLHDQNGTMAWEGYLFRIDREKNRVSYRNRPATQKSK